MTQIIEQITTRVDGLGDWEECPNPPSGLNKAICSIHASNQYGRFRGTGFFVSPNVLLTARHMVRFIDPISGETEFRSNINLVLGYDQNGRPLKRCRIVTENISEFAIGEDSNRFFDCVLIRINHAHQCEDYFAIGSKSLDDLQGLELRVAGYPTVDLDRLPLSGTYQYQSTEQFFDERVSEDNVAEIKNDVMPGHSGSPIFLSEQKVALGVTVSEGADGEQKNYALLFNESLKTKLNQLL